MIGLLKGLHATIGHLLTKKATVQYPDVKRTLPDRSRGLIRLRMKEGLEPRCISCTFCEQVCPAIAIKVIFDYKQPEKVWTFDAGAGPMLTRLNLGEKAVGMEPWPEDNSVQPAPETDGCLAASFIGAEKLTPMVIAHAARKNGVWLSQAFGIATFYDQLGPGAPALDKEPPLPEVYGAVEGSPAVITGGFGAIDLGSIDAYTAAGGYRAVVTAISETSPAEVVDEISISGLRGRGGSGFSTGKKWGFALESEDAQKYVICNGGEGDPGSFKDRAILEKSPHSVIEGMIAAGYAVGASQGYICLNAAHRTAIETMRNAVEQAQDQGFLGETVANSQFAFNIKVIALPEAFIGGEETALISTLEGKRPQSRVRPPYPTEKGLFGQPTIVENVETLATVPWILKNGAREFQQIGAAQAPGTKLFTLSGRVANPGVYEAPLSISVKKLVEGAAGGFTAEPRAALVGSVGGGFLSAGLLDIPLDFDSLREAGGDLSSGVIEILGPEDCIVEKVRSCLAFSSSQACGKCVPDRLGTRRLLDIVERICAGRTREDDLELAQDLAEDIAAGSLCSLGRGAVRPFVTALKFFSDEFEEHMREGKCSAGKCVMD